MKLDALIERLGGELRAAKQQLVTEVAEVAKVAEVVDGSADLDPRLMFIRGDEPAALAQILGEGMQLVVGALAIGAAGFDADITAACFDTYTLEKTLGLDAIVESLVTGDGLDLSDPEPRGEALQIYAANRAGDVRWAEHCYAVDGPVVTWAKPVIHDEHELTGGVLLSNLTEVMAQPTFMQAAHRPDAPAWVKAGLVETQHLDPEENRYIQDVGTAQTLKALLGGQVAVTLYAQRDTPRHRVMQRLPLSSFPFL